VDIHPRIIGNHYAVEDPVVGDARLVLEDILEERIPPVNSWLKESGIEPFGQDPC
jgi:thiamine pyrophosphate-dependent acetolactate synthase large subunit-like protein